LSIFSNIAAYSKNIDFPLQTAKATKLYDNLNDSEDDDNKILYDHIEDEEPKISELKTHQEQDFHKYDEPENRFSPKPEDLENDEEEEMDVLPDDFTNLLAGKKNTDEKVVYFSTLNSHDKPEDQHSHDESNEPGMQ